MAEPEGDDPESFARAMAAEVAHQLRYADVTALYAAVGEGHISTQSVIEKVTALVSSQEDTSTGPIEIPHVGRSKAPRGGDSGVLVRGAPDILVARVKGVASREAAEALNRIALHVHRERLGAPEDEDEFLATDLVGLAVFDPQGREIGRLRGVENYGGGDLLEIVPLAGGASALLPFTKAFVPSLDVAGGRITVDAPDDLFDPPGPRPKDEPA